MKTDGIPSATEATVTPTLTAIAPPTLHTSPTPSQTGPTAAAENVGLYVGIAVPAGLVTIAVPAILILLLFVMRKKRKHKQTGKIIVFELRLSINHINKFSEVVTYQATNSGHYEDINTAPIISTNREVPSTQEPLYTTIEESTDSNSNLTQSKAYGEVIETGVDYYENEEMGWLNEVTITTNNAYGTTKQPQLTYDYIANHNSAVSHDPPTILNPAYGDVTTTKDSVIATDPNRLSGTQEEGMIRNEAYVGVRQSSSDNGPSIPTTENEAYTSVTANTEPYDYIRS